MAQVKGAYGTSGANQNRKNAITRRMKRDRKAGRMTELDAARVKARNDKLKKLPKDSGPSSGFGSFLFG